MNFVMVQLIGGPFDGEFRSVPAEWPAAGAVLWSTPAFSVKTRFCVYLPNGRGDMEFDSYAATFDEGLAKLPKGDRAGGCA